MSQSSIQVPNGVTLIGLSLSSFSKTVTLPVIASNPGRMLIFKDMFGRAAISTIRVSTSQDDIIERSNVSSIILSTNYGAWTFLNDGINKWFLTSAYLNSLTINGFFFSNGLWVKSYTNTGTQPNSNGPTSFTGNSGSWGSLLTTTYVGNIFQGSNTPGPTSFMYYGNNYGIYPTGNTNYQLIVQGFFFSASPGTIQFQIVTDDGFRLDFNNVNAINQFQPQGATTYTSAVLTLPAGYTPLTMRWYDSGGGGAATMQYNLNGAGYTSNGTGRYFYNTANITQT